MFLSRMLPYRLAAGGGVGSGLLFRHTRNLFNQPRWISTQNLSIRRGPTTPPLYRGTIPEHFASVVSEHGDRPALVVWSPVPSMSTVRAAETTLTYTQLDVLSNRLGSSLSRLGVRKGDRVAVSLGSTVAFTALTYALFKLGAVLVPLNPSFTAAQVTSALRHLGATVLVMGAVTDLPYRPARGRSNESLLQAIITDDGDGDGGVGRGTPYEPPSIRSSAVPSLRHVVVHDNRGDHPDIPHFQLDRRLKLYHDLVEGGAAGPVTPSAPLGPEDTINIQFTSGTTSAPKAAMLSHTSILNNGRLIAHRMVLDASDRIVVPPPLFHCFGSVLGLMATATTGASILFPSPAFDPVASMRMACRHRATGLYGVATMFVAYLEALDTHPASSPSPSKPTSLVPPPNLRKGIVAGSSVPESLMHTVQSRLGLEDLVICYGMTETSPVSCMTRPSDPPEYRASTVGTPMPHTAVKIVDPADRSRILPLGQRGELAASGYLTMAGYYGDPVRTREVLVADQETGRDPPSIWMYSGDEASMDEEGFVRITGRIKDLIIRAGENIHPLDIENCLFQMPGVHEVSVVGIPDEKLGEAVGAFIIKESSGSRCSEIDGEGKKEEEISESSVRDWVRSHLSSHMVPKYIFWVDEYPKTASGKIQKFKLAELGAQILGV